MHPQPTKDREDVSLPSRTPNSIASNKATQIFRSRFHWRSCSLQFIDATGIFLTGHDGDVHQRVSIVPLLAISTR
jgi:hypothetical protein